MAIPEIGEAGQQRLGTSRVLIVGAGGLGSPAALYLAAAGVGTLGMVDDDRVERSNLHRQILHPESRVGMSKVASAQASVAAINSAVTFIGHDQRMNTDNAAALIAGYDLVIDGSDNFETRYALNDACVAAGVPLVHGSVYRFEGQVAAFWPAREGPCYRCVFPEPPPAEMAPSCAEAGVLGVLPGIIGLFQATEAVKLLLGLGQPLLGRLLAYDALRSEVRTLRIARRPDCECRHQSTDTVPA
jgi:molybdopterin/thiamine biosynthesis adenylyltransferase